jgi:hypothetical protein
MITSHIRQVQTAVIRLSTHSNRKDDRSIRNTAPNLEFVTLLSTVGMIVELRLYSVVQSVSPYFLYKILVSK